MKRSLTLAATAAIAGSVQAVVLAPVAGGPTARVTDTTVPALAAAGSFAGTDTGNANSVRDTLDTLAFHFSSLVPGGTAAWALWDKTDSASGSQAHTFTGTASGNTGTLSFNAPITGWFALTVKAGNQFSLYLFDGGTAGIGAVRYVTTGAAVNNRGIGLGLSHASLWGGTAPVTSPVPEPETWALLLAGAAVLGFRVRRDAPR